MKEKPIHQRSMLYIVLQRYVNTCIRLFCRRINIIGKENLPKDGAIIFAPNHKSRLAFKIPPLMVAWQLIILKFAIEAAKLNDFGEKIWRCRGGSSPLQLPLNNLWPTLFEFGVKTINLPFGFKGAFTPLHQQKKVSFIISSFSWFHN